MTHLISRVLRRLRYWRACAQHRSCLCARMITKYNLDRKAVSFDATTRALRLDQLDFSVILPGEAFVLEALPLVEELAAVANAVLGRDDKGSIVIDVGGVRMGISNADEVFILKEIYVDGIYSIETRESVRVIDIGMNVGFASLFFARNGASEVYAFEPFTESFERAQANCYLNPDLADRIHAFNYAIGSADGETEAYFSSHSPGHSGLFMNEGTSEQRSRSCSRHVPIRDVAAVVREICGNNDGRPLVAKIDCEGAEYSIFQRLSETGLLGAFSAFMLEWHRRATDHDPRMLLALLRDAGFACFPSLPLSGPVGTLYAVHLRRP